MHTPSTKSSVHVPVALGLVGEALGVPNTLAPGVAVLGCAFDTFGCFDTSATSGKQKLFDFGQQGSNTLPYNGVVYSLPENVGWTPAGSSGAVVKNFASREEVSEAFSAEASVSGSYLAFSAEIEAAYADAAHTVSECYLTMVSITVGGYELSIGQPDATRLTPAASAALTALQSPSTTQKDFFDFFDRFGAYFVRSVVVGGRLYYTSSVSKSMVTSSTDYAGKATASYEGLFGASATAAAAWATATEDFCAESNVTVRSIGGLVPAGLTQPPVYGENRSADLATWQRSVATLPAEVSFGLMPVYEIFGGTFRDALKDATIAYTQSRLQLEITAAATGQGQTASVTVNGQLVLEIETPPTPGTLWDGRALVLVLDRATLSTRFGQVYDLIGDPGSVPTGLNNAFSALGTTLTNYAGDRTVIVLVSIWGLHSGLPFPSGALLQFLHSLGAGSGLQDWHDHPSDSGGAILFDYALIGVPGSGPNTGVELMTDIARPRPYSFPGASLSVFLKPEYTLGSLQYTPT